MAAGHLVVNVIDRAFGGGHGSDAILDIEAVARDPGRGAGDGVGHGVSAAQRIEVIADGFAGRVEIVVGVKRLARDATQGVVGVDGLIALEIQAA